jgi:Tfp pilus assembly PilM family ATPase
MVWLNDMVWLKDHTCSKVPILRHIAKCTPIGIDIGDDTVKMVQLSNNGKGVSLIAGGSKAQPENVKPGTGYWQRWVIEAVRELMTNSKFRARDVVAAIPATDVFIDHVRIPKPKDGSNAEEKLHDAIFPKLKQKLPFEANDALIKYIPTEESHAVVIAAERQIIDRHLAIYENANLQIKSIAVWPVALINSYTSFFARRKADIEAVVMLLEIDSNRTNAVVCRHKNLLFARTIPIGVKQLDDGDSVARLVLELNACKRHIASMYKNAPIERVIFLSSMVRSQSVCATIAKQLEMPAQVGDCLAAVKMDDPAHSGIDRRDCSVNWATAFGLSLS